MDATAMTLGQGHGKVIQYISPDPYIRCAKYQMFSSNTDIFLRWSKETIKGEQDSLSWLQACW